MTSTRPEPSDEELVARARDGDASAFHVIVDRYGASLFRLAAYLTGNESDAEDVVQETLTAGLTGLRGFRGEASLRTWLTRILVRRAALWRRSKGRPQTGQSMLS